MSILVVDRKIIFGEAVVEIQDDAVADLRLAINLTMLNALLIEPEPSHCLDHSVAQFGNNPLLRLRPFLLVGAVAFVIGIQRRETGQQHGRKDPQAQGRVKKLPDAAGGIFGGHGVVYIVADRSFIEKN